MNYTKYPWPLVRFSSLIKLQLLMTLNNDIGHTAVAPDFPIIAVCSRQEATIFASCIDSF